MKIMEKGENFLRSVKILDFIQEAGDLGYSHGSKVSGRDPRFYKYTCNASVFSKEKVSYIFFRAAVIISQIEKKRKILFILL